MREPQFLPGWLQRQVASSVRALSRIPASYGGTAPARVVESPMSEAAITDVIEGVLDDWLGDAEPPNRHREIAEALTESWLKDRRRAVGQGATATGS